MKKLVYLGTVFIVLISMVGCQSDVNLDATDANHETEIIPTETEAPGEVDETQEAEITEVTPTTENTDESGIEVDQGLFDVTITLPASFFEDDPDFDPDAYNEENGYKNTVQNEDGSVSITMSKAQHNEIMAEMKLTIDQSFMDLIEAEDTPYIKAITSSDGYETVTVEVEKEGYENSWDFTPLLIGFSAMMYQQFDGADLHCEISVRDYETGETLYEVVYPDVLND